MKAGQRVLGRVLWILLLSHPSWGVQQSSSKGTPPPPKEERAKEKAATKKPPTTEPAKDPGAKKIPPETAGTKEGAGTKTPAKAVEAMDSSVAYKITRYDSGNKRDPFLNLLLLKRKTQEQSEEVSRGQPPAGIAGMYLAQVALLGTSQREGTFTAVFQGTDKRAYFLHDGDRLFDGYVKQIKADSVVMVRETRLKSGEVTTQEVTKQLRIP